VHGVFQSSCFSRPGRHPSCNEEHDIFKMGGLIAKPLPVAFWTFLIGSCSLSALPLVSAAVYSKDAHHFQRLVVDYGKRVALALAPRQARLLTAVYSFRVVFIVFFGAPAPDFLEKKPDFAQSASCNTFLFRTGCGFILLSVPQAVTGSFFSKYS